MKEVKNGTKLYIQQRIVLNCPTVVSVCVYVCVLQVYSVRDKVNKPLFNNNLICIRNKETFNLGRFNPSDLMKYQTFRMTR